MHDALREETGDQKRVATLQQFHQAFVRFALRPPVGGFLDQQSARLARVPHPFEGCRHCDLSADQGARWRSGAQAVSDYAAFAFLSRPAPALVGLHLAVRAQ